MPSDWKARWTALSRKATWPLVYSVAPRILVGLKILAMARLLGPQEFGLYALAFLWLTVMEGISDFGFRPAIVQSRDELSDHQLGQINTVQLVRGLVLIPLVAGAAWLARGYLGEGFFAVVLVSLVPVARGFYGIPVAVAQRKMDFKGLSGFELSWRALDLVMCLAAALIWKNSFAVVVASILGEFSGPLVSFVWLRVRITFVRSNLKTTPCDEVRSVNFGAREFPAPLRTIQRFLGGARCTVDGKMFGDQICDMIPPPQYDIEPHDRFLSKVFTKWKSVVLGGKMFRLIVCGDNVCVIAKLLCNGCKCSVIEIGLSSNMRKDFVFLFRRLFNQNPVERPIFQI